MLHEPDEKTGDDRIRHQKDLLISVGDLVDRGTENVECLELITFPWFRAVRGNHEHMMIDGLSERGNVNHWLLNGGGWFFNLDYDKEILAKALAHKADELPLIIELVSKDKNMSSATPIILVTNTSLESQLIISR